MRFFLIAITIFLLYYLFDVVLVLIAAIVVASAVEPIIRRMQRRKIHRIIAAVLIYIVIALFFVAIFIFFLPMVVNDLIVFLRTVPENVSLQDLWGPIQSNIGFSFGSISNLFAEKTIPVSDFAETLQSTIIGSSAGVFKTATLIFGGMMSFILIVVLSFYLAVQEEGVDDFLRIITPVNRHDYIIDLWKRSQRKIGYWLQGQILLGVIIAVLVYLVLMIVGVPHALVLAILAGLLEIIPVFGPIIAAVPAVLIAFADAGVTKGLLIIGLYLIIHQFENQLFYPLVVKKIVGISPIVVILALVIGAKIAGILGAILAVPLSAALMEYVSDIEKRKKHEKQSRVEA